MAPLLWVAGVLLLLLWMFTLVERAIVPTLVAIAETEVNRVANRAMIDAINENIATLLQGRQLLHFETAPDGSLLYVSANTAELSRVQAESLAVLETALERLEGFAVDVPLGQVLGSRIFAHSGPNIPVTLYPFGAVEAHIRDSFEVTGINQTRYNVFLNVKCLVRVVIPLISAKSEVSTDIPLAAILIPGKVPDTYLNLRAP